MRRAAFVFVSLLGLRMLQADSIYSVSNLGNLVGGTATAYRISNSGEVVGWAQTAAGDTHPFRSLAGSAIEDLAGANVSDGFAYGVNDSGQIAETAYIDGHPHGLVSGLSGTTDLGPDSYALAVNNNGQAAGGNAHAILYSNGVVKDLGTLPGGSWSAAYDINSSGAVAGTSDTSRGFRGFVWTSSAGMTTMGTFGGNNSHATAINDSGMVAGFAALPTGYEHAFVDVNGAMLDLGTLGGGSSFAYDVNNAGAAVGYSWLAAGPNPHAFLYSNSILVDLNSLIPTSSGWELLEAYGINDAGQIVGEGLYQGRDQAFLLNPTPAQVSQSVMLGTLQSNSIGPGVPEPGTLMLLLNGAGLICVRCLPLRWKRKPRGIPA